MCKKKSWLLIHKIIWLHRHIHLTSTYTLHMHTQKYQGLFLVLYKSLTLQSGHLCMCVCVCATYSTVSTHGVCIYADRLLKYFWAGPSVTSDDKRFPSWPIVSFVSIVCHRSHAGHNDPWLRVVSPDLAAMLIASICLATLDYVDIFERHGDKTYGGWRECFNSCLCDWQTKRTNGIGSQAVTSHNFHLWKLE